MELQEIIADVAVYDETIDVMGNISVVGALSVSGDVNCGGNFKGGQLFVRGNAQFAGDIEADRIIVDGVLFAQGHIRAKETIVTGEGIVARGYVEGARIHTGGTIKTEQWVECKDFDIICEDIKNKLLPHGRKYWENHPLLKEFKDQIADPDKCWHHMRKLAKRHEAMARKIEFEHWYLTVQFRNFAGLPYEMPKLDFAGVPKTRNDVLKYDMSIIPKPENASTALVDIINDPTVTPFQDYTGNQTYGMLCEACGVPDIRVEYQNLDKAIDTLRAGVDSVQNPPEPAVKAQIISEINMVGDVRAILSSHHDFITDSFTDKVSRILAITDICKTSHNVTILMDILGAMGSVIGLINGVAGGIASVLLAVATVMRDSGQGNPVSGTITSMTTQLTDAFQKALIANAAIATGTVSDWGKLQKVEALINDGTLAWNATQQAEAVGVASEEWERQMWYRILPICWWPTFSYFYWDHDTNHCGNVVWMTGDCTWGGVEQYDFIPYWLVRGMGFWWDNGINAVMDELNRVGVTLPQIIRGDGVWGPIYDYYRKNPLGQQEKPSCVSKN